MIRDGECVERVSRFRDCSHRARCNAVVESLEDVVRDASSASKFDVRINHCQTRREIMIPRKQDARETRAVITADAFSAEDFRRACGRRNQPR